MTARTSESWNPSSQPKEPWRRQDESSFWKCKELQFEGHCLAKKRQATEPPGLLLIFKCLPAASQCPVLPCCSLKTYRDFQPLLAFLFVTHLNIKNGLSQCFSLLTFPTSQYYVTPTSPKGRCSLPSNPSPEENRICTSTV